MNDQKTKDRQRNGVVHVGAHLGEETESYLAEHRSPVLCFEPQALGWSPPPGVQLIPMALADVSGRLVMRVPHHLHTTQDRDTQSASGLTLIPEAAARIGWRQRRHDILYADVCRFDEWAAASGFVSGSCGLLVIDVQGMELQVLKGFGAYLDGFLTLIIECSEIPLYEGGASAQQVSDYLALRDFQRTSPVVAHGDVHFMRNV